MILANFLLLLLFFYAYIFLRKRISRAKFSDSHFVVDFLKKYSKYDFCTKEIISVRKKIAESYLGFSYKKLGMTTTLSELEGLGLDFDFYLGISDLYDDIQDLSEQDAEIDIPENIGALVFLILSLLKKSKNANIKKHWISD